MKRNNLVTAVLAGVAGIAGIASSAQAVNINPDGLGQVLIYPYYTTNNGLQTVLSVVNTTDEAKAVKVRFLESLNSREVLDFNLYMSAYDVWTAALYDNAGVPTMETVDSSCTVPYFFSNSMGIQPFLNFAYSGPNADADPERASITRASEGHFEVIEMGAMFGPSAAAATHVQPGAGPNQQLPADCAALVAAWSIVDDVDGYWLADSSVDISAPTGGLFGGAALINVGEGTMFSYDAKAINGFWDDSVSAGVRHSGPGDELPSLTSGQATTANLFDDQGNALALTYTSSIEAVSALFMHDSVMNEYAIIAGLAARSEWILTFPTKRFYIDPAFAGVGVPIAPFTDALRTNATACEDLSIDFWDREEGVPTATPGSTVPLPSPLPPVIIPDVISFELCAETNVIRFDEREDAPDDQQTPAAPIVGTNGFDSLVTFTLPIGYDAGWARIDMPLNRDNAGILQPNRMDAQGLLGLPVVGFWFESFTNGNLNGGTVLANYGGIFEHKGTRQQVIIATQ
ncbi:MAG: hypothetical protein L3J24_10330 [Xanthomonadales bacterium]|nr:hypothetical protein [Xanthomonadales bacterium]